MKRKHRTLAALAAGLLAALVACLLASCAPAQPPDPLTEEGQNAIVAAYIAQTKDDLRAEDLAYYSEENVTFEAYYGTYGGCAVFSLHDGNFGYTAAIEEVVVGGVHICTNPSGEAHPRVYIAESERVTSLHPAYVEGLLTKADLRSIAAAIRAVQAAQ